MLSLVEELEENNIVFLLLESTNGFYYAEYTVAISEYKGLRNHFAKLILKNSHIKRRYFNDVITVSGFRLEDNKTLKRSYKFFDDKEDMIKAFYRYLEKHVEENQKLLKKIKNRFPEYF
jgi:hypothetical protein